MPTVCINSARAHASPLSIKLSPHSKPSPRAGRRRLQTLPMNCSTAPSRKAWRSSTSTIRSLTTRQRTSCPTVGPNTYHCTDVTLTTSFFVTHSYFKLDYIEQNWGGRDEYLEELANGNPNARDWQAHARGIVEDAVCLLLLLMSRHTDHLCRCVSTGRSDSSSRRVPRMLPHRPPAAR